MIIKIIKMSCLNGNIKESKNIIKYSNYNKNLIKYKIYIFFKII